MENLSGWIAPIATMIAAMLTAANLGARVTGWGFVIFTIGSVCWSIVGFSTGQTNLLATNGFLTLVNLVGMWRWLGRQRAYEDGGKSAIIASRRSAAPTLFTATGLAGMPVEDVHGVGIGKAIEGLIECATGKMSYVVVAAGVGGIGEGLRAVPVHRVHFEPERLRIGMDENAFLAERVLESGAWPAEAAASSGPVSA